MTQENGHTATEYRKALAALVAAVKGQLGSKSERVMSHNLQRAYKRAKELLGE